MNSCKTAATALLLASFLIPGVVLAQSRPVVLELFTSNSCSSCPPAYELLRELHASPPLEDVQLILLDQHVDYWNDLGWKDRYSDALFTRRQRDYARYVFGSGHVYTPQLVVNGRRDMVGSRRGEVRAAIVEAADEADLDVTLKTASTVADAVDVMVTVAGEVKSDATVWLALTQDDVVSHIGAGENGGRRGAGRPGSGRLRTGPGFKGRTRSRSPTATYFDCLVRTRPSTVGMTPTQVALRQFNATSKIPVVIRALPVLADHAHVARFFLLQRDVPPAIANR